MMMMQMHMETREQNTKHELAVITISMIINGFNKNRPLLITHAHDFNTIFVVVVVFNCIIELTRLFIYVIANDVGQF